MNYKRNYRMRSNDLVGGLDIISKYYHKKPNISNKRSNIDKFINYCDNHCTDDIIDSPIKPSFIKKIPNKKIHINENITNLDDLINMINKYPIIENIDYNINMEILHKIKPYLINLNNMIGINNLKNHIVDQLLYFLQNFHKTQHYNDFMHTVIYGPPGTGKTEIAKILGSIFSSINVLSKCSFNKVTRSDLIAGYLGQTAIKTKEVIQNSLGGVLFIDEAYSLGNNEKRDSFAKECLDTLCESLTDHKDDLMVIIAGYEEQLDECFFAYNPGLNSRFTWRFHTDKYTSNELKEILIKKILDINWSYSEDFIDDKWFEKNYDYFQSYGRDIETFLTKIKIAHSRRVFCLDESEKKYITKIDIEEGFKIYLANNHILKSKNNKENNHLYLNSMYS